MNLKSYINIRFLLIFFEVFPLLFSIIFNIKNYSVNIDF